MAITEDQRKSRLETILPVNASQLEVDLLATFNSVIERLLLQMFGDEVGIALKYLWNPSLCPPQALPHLATALSVDVDISEFSLEQQRSLIRESFRVHQRKGTVGSVRRVIESLGWQLAENGIVEGRRDPTDETKVIREGGGWAQFSIKLNQVIPRRQAVAAAKLIQATAPLSRRLVSVDFSSSQLFLNGGVNSEGDYTFFLDGTYTLGSVNTNERIIA